MLNCPTIPKKFIQDSVVSSFILLTGYHSIAAHNDAKNVADPTYGRTGHEKDGVNVETDYYYYSENH